MPPPPDQRVDNEIEQFLAWSASQAREGYTIANLMLRQEQFFIEMRSRANAQDSKIHGQDTKFHNLNGRVSELENSRDELYGIVGEHGTALVAVKRRIRTGPHDQEMDTGVHQLVAIQQRLAEQERKRSESERVRAEDVVWWKRTIIQVVFGIIAWVTATALTVLITLAIAGNNSAAKPTANSAPPSSQH